MLFQLSSLLLSFIKAPLSSLIKTFGSLSIYCLSVIISWYSLLNVVRQDLPVAIGEVSSELKQQFKLTLLPITFLHLSSFFVPICFSLVFAEIVLAKILLVAYLFCIAYQSQHLAKVFACSFLVCSLIHFMVAAYPEAKFFAILFYVIVILVFQ